MAVGTGNISLQDVVNEIEGIEGPDFLPSESLATCFNSTYNNEYGFDATYNSASDNRLSEFKGYDHDAQPPNYSIAVSGTTSIPIQGGTFSYTMSISPSNSNASVSVSYQPNEVGGQTETGWISIGSIPSSGSTRSFSITYSSNQGLEGDRYANITFTNSSDPNTPKDSSTLSITQTGFS